ECCIACPLVQKPVPGCYTGCYKVLQRVQPRMLHLSKCQEWLASRARFAQAFSPAMKTRFVFFSTALAASLFAFGCSKKDEASASGQPGSKQKIFVMIPKGVHPYYEPCYEGFKDAGAKYGVKTEYLAAKAFEVPQEVEIIENMIARHVDGIAI